MKKLIAVLLALIMTFSVTATAFPAFAAENTSASTTTEESSSAEEPTYGRPGLTEQQIAELIANSSSGSGLKLNLKLAKVFYKLATVFGKLHLTSLKKACLNIAANLLEKFVKGDEPEEPDEPIEIADISVSAPAYAGRGGAIDVFFTISANTTKAPTYVIINGQKVPLTKQADGTYKATVNAPAERPEGGKAAYSVTKVYYGNTEIDVDCTFEITITKAEPTVADSSFKVEVTDNDTINVSFKITDTDKTVSSVYVLLIDSNGQIIERKTLDVTENGEYDASFTQETAGTYSIEILADYNCSDDDDYLEKATIYTAENAAEIKLTAEITTESVSGDYFEKSTDETTQSVTVIYSITTNSDKAVSSLTINGVSYTPEAVENKYQVVVDLPDYAGVFTINVTEVRCGDLSAFVEHSDSVEVLKDAPYVDIDNLTTIYDYANDQVTFTFTVVNDDNAEVTGTATVEDVTLPIRDGQNALTFAAVPNQLTDLNIHIDYDRDIDDQNEQNNDSADYTIQFNLAKNYTFTVNNAVTYKIVTDSPEDQESKYFEKNEAVRVLFSFANGTNMQPVSVKINGEYYTLTALRDNYYVDFANGFDTSGVKTLTVEEVKLSDGYTVKTDEPLYEFKLEVLKEKPAVTDATVSNNGTDVTVNIFVTDPDDALIEGKLLVKDSEDDVVFEQSLSVGNNIVSFSLVAGDTYRIIFQNNYDLDTDELGGADENQAVEEFKIQEITIQKAEDIDFLAVNVNLPKSVKENDTLILTFENSYYCVYDVESVVISGVSYQVAKSGNVYSVELPKGNIGNNVIKFESATLNGKVFPVNRNFTYVYENATPIAENIVITEDILNNTSAATFEINDKANAVKALYAVVKNSRNQKISEIALESISTRSLTFTNPKEYNYSVDILADYDRGNGEIIKKAVIGTGTFYTAPRVTIVNAKFDSETRSYNKNQVFQFIFEVSTNVNQAIKNITINDENWPVTKIAENTYRINKMYAPGVGGTYELNVTNVNLYGLNVAVNYTTSIEVLREKPTITHFNFEKGDNGKTTLSFKLNDDEGALTSDVTVKVTDGDNVILNTTINKSQEYSYELDGITANKDYQFTATASYNLYGPNATGSNEVTDDIEDRKLALYDGDYGFTFMLLYPDATYPAYVAPGVEAYVMFTCTNNTQRYSLDSLIIDGKSYKVRDEGYAYTLIGLYIDDPDVKTLTIEKAVLSNGKSIDITSGNIINVDLMVDPAVADILAVEENVEDNSLTVDFSVVDKYKTITDSMVTVVLKDATGKVIDSQKVPYTTRSVTFENLPISSKYTVEILANVKFHEFMGGEQSNYKISTTYTISASTETVIFGANLSTKYPTRNKLIAISYNISTVRNSAIQALIINGQQYTVEKQDDNGLYKVYYQAPNESGVHEIAVSAIIFKDGYVANFKYTSRIDVIKDAPVISGFRLDSDYASQRVTAVFDVTDNDNILTNGGTINAEFNGQTKPVAAGHNEIVFEKVPQNQLLTFTLKATYDLDTDQLNVEDGNKDQNNFNNTAILTKNFKLTDSYQYEFSNLATDKTYYQKNEAVKVSFKYICDEAEYPEKLIVDGREYILTRKGDSYSVKLVGYENAGKKDITFKIVLSNGKVLESEGFSKTVEVLKDVPTVSSFNYTQGAQSMTVNFTVHDEDSALIGDSVTVVIQDKNGAELNRSTVNKNNCSVTFNTNGKDAFAVSVIANYDRDTDAIDENSNRYENEEIAYEYISFETRKIELKDIDDIELYHYLADNSVAVAGSVDIEDLNNLGNYLVKIKMKDLPGYFARIESFRVDDGKLVLTLNVSDHIQYDNEAVTTVLEVIYGTVDGNTATKKDFYNPVYNGPSGLYIPDYEMLSKMPEYAQAKNKIYHNLYKLMPFADSKYIVLDGALISEDDILNKQLIKYIFALNKNGDIVSSLTTENYNSIAKIKVLFDDDTVKEYKLTFDNYIGDVALYSIKGINVGYTYNKYVIKAGNRAMSVLIDTAKALNYTNDLDPITSGEDSRIYRDYYNETTVNNIRAFVENLVAGRYSATFDHDILTKLVEQDLVDNGKLKELLYAYNYFSRWYDFEIGEINIRDSMLFGGKMFNADMTLEALASRVKSGNISTGATDSFYANNIARYTGKTNIGNFLDYYISVFGGYEDVDDWFTENFNGVIAEVGIDSDPGVYYRAWHHLKNRSNLLLPLVTIPENSGYLISAPLQMAVGSQRVYLTDPNDSEQHERIVSMVQEHAAKVKRWSLGLYNILGQTYLNKVSELAIDRRYTNGKDGSSNIESAGTTEEPFHKNFNEVVGLWAHLQGSAAYASKPQVYYELYAILDYWHAYTHEQGHNQIDDIFLQGRQLRSSYSPGGEDYTDGTVTQTFDDGSVTFNFTFDYSKDTNMSMNWTPERVNSIEKMDDFYKKLFLTSDFLDYVEAQAFLQLSADEQAKIAVQAYYPGESAANMSIDKGSTTTGYRLITANDINSWGGLHTMADLYDHRIVIKPGENGTTVNEGCSYATSSIYWVRWYQPHNNGVGKPDSPNYKYLAYEMMGQAGFEKGWQGWHSDMYGRDVGDDVVLKAVTGYSTFREYKLARYNAMKEIYEDMLENGTENYLIDAQQVYNDYLTALKADAASGNRNVTNGTNVKRNYYYQLKRATDDFRSDVFANVSDFTKVIHVSTAQEFVEAATNNNVATIYLDASIDLAEYTTGNAVIANSFSGTIEGQNNTVSNLFLPLFTTLSGATVKDLKIDNATVRVGAQNMGALAKNATNSNISNVIMSNSIVNSRSNQQVGGLVGYAFGSTFENVHVTASKIYGLNRVGGLIGYATDKCIIKQSSVANTDVTTTSSASALFIGETVNNTQVLDCYAVGTLTVHNTPNDCGGFIGYANNTVIHNNFAKVEMFAPANAGGFVGQVVGSADIKNNISLTNCLTTAYKFDGRTGSGLYLASGYMNNYELSDASGTPTKNKNNSIATGKHIIEIASSAINADFFRTTLQWSESVWDLSSVNEGGLPKLLNSDPNSGLTIK